MKYTDQLLELPENTMKTALIPFVAIPILFSTVVTVLAKKVLSQNSKNQH